MSKWAAAFAVVLVALAAVYWLLKYDSPTQIVAPGNQLSENNAPPTPPDTPQGRSTTSPAPTARQKTKIEQKTTAPDQLDPTSEEFSDRIDVSIPDGFRAKLANCDRRNMDPDAKISFTYDLHIEKGIVSASNVQIDKSDLNNQNLEQCMVIALQNSRWQVADMPDFTEEQDLFVRMRSLDKYLSPEDQKKAKEQNNEGDGTPSPSED